MFYLTEARPWMREPPKYRRNARPSIQLRSRAADYVKGAWRRCTLGALTLLVLWLSDSDQQVADGAVNESRAATHKSDLSERPERSGWVARHRRGDPDALG